jgi:4-hydroxy-tetrahydrodipicolinate reductase
MAQLMLDKEGIELVGAVDALPEYDGKDLGDVLGTAPVGVPVTADPDQVLPGADVVVIATTSWVEKQLPDLLRILSAGVNVVSIAEEMAAPEAQHPEVAARLDAVAKEHGVSLVGVGVNPGFVLDLLIATLTAGSQQVTRIEASRVNDLSPYGQTVLSTQGVGTTPEQFAAGVADGSIVGHVGFPESVRLISDALGLGVDRVEQKVEPIISKVRREVRDLVVEPGQVAGCNHTAIGYRGEDEVVVLHHPQQVHPEAEGQSTGDYITIFGVPEIHLSTGPEIAGGIATAGMAVNTVPRIFAATPGLKRVIDLPVPTALMGGSAYERR